MIRDRWVLLLIVVGFATMFTNVWVDDIHSIISILLLALTISSLVTALIIISPQEIKEKQNDE